MFWCFPSVPEVFAGRRLSRQISSLVPIQPLDTQVFWIMYHLSSASRTLTVPLAGKESWTEKASLLEVHVLLFRDQFILSFSKLSAQERHIR